MLNQLVTLDDTGGAVTSSPVIAEGTETDHASVIKLVRTYVSDLEEFGRVRFEIQPFETSGGTQSREIALLNEQQATLILTYMRNSDIVRIFKKALVKAFWELARREQPTAFGLANLPSTALLEMAVAMSKERDESERKRLYAESRIAVLAPKAELHDRYGGIPVGYLSLRDAAKHFGWGPQAFIEKLHNMKWIFRNGRKNWTPYQDKLDRGLMDFKTTIGDHGFPQEQALFTPRGMAILAGELEHPKPKRRYKNDSGNNDDVMPLVFG